MSSPGTSSGRRQSAILVPVPDAEPVVGPWRQEHDPVAPAGVPAHITLIVPWLPPDEIGDDDLAELGDALDGVEPFEFSLAATGWFARRVLYLTPAPAAPFVALTARLADRFGTPPYDDEFDEVVPHLTIGHASDGVELASVAAALERQLPLTCRASEVWVMVGDGSTWSRRAAFPLPGRPLT
ncbi:MAG TPA: 2'-5' RNA ligase family protein [Acidimicrobiales bacterium]|nr:2'-5' RNA ligase family protein [Acidimicrobiales bacterium]